ncbi:MAG: MFS transporter [Defluviitaleaceae bacterium]|nr:MFS transporter [Defluviitaleaceae bacterium]
MDLTTTPKKLWNRNFSLLIIGQVMSIFGNMVLSWALPFYILDISDSSLLYGLVLGLPYASLLLITPFGGIMADRLKKQRIMFWLDSATTVLVVLYMIASGFGIAAVPLVIVKLLALNAIQGMYMPAVQAAIPALVPSDKLVAANGTTSIVNSISQIAAPAAAGILYGKFGLSPILVICAVCFAFTAVMDLLIRIPYKKRSSPGSIAKMIKSDISQAVGFVIKEKPVLLKGVVVIFIFSITVLSLLIIGIPVLVTQNLGMDMEMSGISLSIMMVGMILAGGGAAAMGSRLKIQNVYVPLILSSLSVIPMGLVFLFDTSAITAYIIITAASVFTVMFMILFQIQMMAYVQGETPAELIGKVMSILMMLPFVAQALGQILFGALFERFESLPWIIIFAAALISLITAVVSRGFFRKAVYSKTDAVS